MRFFTISCFAVIGLLMLPVMARADDESEGDRPAKSEAREKKKAKEIDKDSDGKLSDKEREAARAAFHEKMVMEFDKDGDGKLNDEERQAAREAMRERTGALGGRRGDRGPGLGRGPDGPRGPRGQGRPPGRAPLLPPGELFEKFDADKNDSLSREEFIKLTEFVRAHRPMGPPPWGPDGRRGLRGPGGRGPDGRGPDGPPPRDGDRPRAAREGGPPRGDRQRDGQRERDGQRRRGDREGRPDAPPPGEQEGENQKDKAEEPENESV